MKLKLIILVSLLMVAVAEARMPQEGDNVGILVGGIGLAGMSFEGTITNVENSLICLNARYAALSGETLWNESKDVCIGTGSIIMLTWLD